MPVKLEIKKKLSSRSERVKCIELHPTLPWVLSGLYTGNILIHDYITQAVLKSFEVANAPIRCAKFIPRAHWLVVGTDDKLLRVYNYNTLEKVKTFSAHEDYIRCLVVHPNFPYLLSSSDDTSIKIWDWERNWEEKRVYEGHSHYVMQVDLNPKDFSTFASASLDRTVKVWGVAGSTNAHFTLSGHAQGVNCVAYYPGGDKPYLLSGGDDMRVKVWDYQTKQCIHNLEGHHNNVSSVGFHPDLPLIISTSEDATAKLWHSTTFRLEQTLNYAMDRTWSQSVLPGSKLLALGFDEGSIVLQLGSDEPLASMTSTGFVIWVKNNEVFSANLRTADEPPQDGDEVTLVPRETEICEFYPQYVQHSPNGRSFAICGDGDYVIKSARAFRNQGYGNAQDFAWGPADYAIKSASLIKVLREGEEKFTYKAPFAVEALFGGTLLTIKGDDMVDLIDWESGKLIRRISIAPKQVYWSESGTFVSLVADENFFILKFNPEAAASQEPDEEGIEDALDVEYEILESVISGGWVSDCFFYTTSSQKLNYSLAGKAMTLATLDRKLFFLGFMPQQSRLYLIDTQRRIVSYAVTLSFIEYQIAVVQEELEKAEEIFPNIPESYHNKCAKFLDGLGYKEEAMAITTDVDHKFDLALQLNFLAEAYEIAAAEGSNANRWKMVGDLALLGGEFELAEECLWKSKDCNGLLLLYSSIGVSAKMEKLAELALSIESYNVAFSCYFLLQSPEKCLDTLIKSKRIPEAAFFARCYCPSKIPEIVKLWKTELEKASPVTAKALCDPTEYPQKFPELTVAVKAEEALKKMYMSPSPASSFNSLMDLVNTDVLEMVKENPNIDFKEILDSAPECPDDPFSV